MKECLRSNFIILTNQLLVTLFLGVSYSFGFSNNLEVQKSNHIQSPFVQFLVTRNIPLGPNADMSFKLVLDSLPPTVKSLLGKKGIHGNCFNATLIFHGFHKIVAHVPQDGIAAWLEKSFRVLAPGETLTQGDTIAFKNADGFILHTVVYAGKDLFFHKPSSSESDQYKVEKFNLVVSPYSSLLDFALIYRKLEQ